MSTDNPDATGQRKQAEFFYVADDGRVQLVKGYACEGAPGYWWCPEVGVSACEGYHLFRDRVDAYNKAYSIARRMVDVAKANLARIEEEQWTRS